MRSTPEWYGNPILAVMLFDHDDPTDYEEAMVSPDSAKWLEAMKSEMRSMYENKVWTLIDLPCVGGTSSSSPRRHADETLPQHSAGSEFEGRHRVEHVLNSEVPYVRYLDRSDREDVRLLPLCCVNASAVDLQGYIDHTLPSRCYASP